MSESILSLRRTIEEAKELSVQREKDEAISDEVPDDEEQREGQEETHLMGSRTNWDGALDRHLPSGARGAGLDEIFRSERERKRKREENRSVAWRNLRPRFNVGDKVYVYVGPRGFGKWRMAVVFGVTLPLEAESIVENRGTMYRVIPIPVRGEVCRELNVPEASLRDRDWSPPKTHNVNEAKSEGSWDQDGSSCLVSNVEPLHSLNVVGIDTCSAMSVSTRREDFLYIDNSASARSSVLLRGVGGNSAAIGGRGPMVVQAHDDNGNEILVIDPSGVHLSESFNG